MSQYVYDLINNAAKQYNTITLIDNNASNDYVVVCDNHPYSYYLAASLARTINADCHSRVNLIYENSEKNQFFEKFLDDNFKGVINRYEKIADYNNAENTDSFDETFIFFFTNLRSEIYKNNDALSNRYSLLKSYLDIAVKKGNTRFMLASYTPVIDTLPGDISGISEREYEVIYRDYPEYSPQKALLCMEEICRDYVEKIKINAIRLDTMFGPHIPDDSPVCIQKFVAEIMNNSTLTAEGNLRHNFYSASFIQDALVKTMVVAKSDINGNIYHISSWHFNLFELIYNLYTLFTNKKIDLKTAESDNDRLCFHVLNPRKIRFLVTPKQINTINTTLRKAIHYTALSTMDDIENYVTEKINVYYGKIHRIRQLELELILQIDEICKKHNIKYFLAGGSMLGALRHGGFIPWDDDMDIGMLPEDYKKFVKVCPPELTAEYSYQTTDLEPASLYIHDKIRIKNTVFTTRYANQFQMQNGVYVDIFVYYKTSNKPRKQRRHIKQIMFMRRILGMRWVNKPRKNFHYYKSLVMLPIMRLFPTTFYRHRYIKLLEKYEKKNTDFLIDGSGFNLDKVGAFPREWFDEITYREFGGHSLPVLKRYDDYLSHWYGEKYMELLPFSSRNSVHDVIRIDLGDKLFEETYGGKFHQLDFRGELYEKIKE